MRRAWRAVGPGLLRVLMPAVALLAGCSLNPPLELDALAPTATPVRLSSVPFFAQTGFQCGPAALAGVLGAAGVATDPATLSPQVYLPAREGSLQLELVAATRRAGRLPYVLAGEPRALLAQLQAGRPVLVLQNLGTPHVPVWHYAVLTGFDPALLNNLASALGELGCPRRAEALLRPVTATLADDSPWKATTDATLKELGAQTGTDGLSCAQWR